MDRLLALRVLAILFAVAGIAACLVRDGSVVDVVAYAAVAGVIVPLGLLAQAWRPGKSIAGLQQVALAALAYAAAGVVADARYLVAAVLVLAALVVLLVLHPVGGVLFALPDDLSPPLLALALLPAAPLAIYGVREGDGALAAMAFAIPLVALLASARTTGWRIPVWSAAAAAALWGAACAYDPGAAASAGRGWGVAAIAWAVAFVVVARQVERVAAPLT